MPLLAGAGGVSGGGVVVGVHAPGGDARAMVDMAVGKVRGAIEVVYSVWGVVSEADVVMCCVRPS